MPDTILIPSRGKKNPYFLSERFINQANSGKNLEQEFRLITDEFITVLIISAKRVKNVVKFTGILIMNNHGNISVNGKITKRQASDGYLYGKINGINDPVIRKQLTLCRTSNDLPEFCRFRD